MTVKCGFGSCVTSVDWVTVKHTVSCGSDVSGIDVDVCSLEHLFETLLGGVKMAAT